MRLPSLLKVESLVRERLDAHPGHPFFVFAKLQTSLIKANLDENGRVGEAFYDRIGLGLLCARELEGIDSDFCDTVYCMLEDIRPK